jgi:hypothetical protein
MELLKERKIMSLMIQSKENRKYVMALNLIKEINWTVSIHDIMQKLTTDETITDVSTDEEIVAACLVEIKAQIVTLCS